VAPQRVGLSHPRGDRWSVSAVVTNRGWDTNDFLPCGKVRATCKDSTGRQKPHTLTWLCGGSCGLQFVSRPTAYQHIESPHEQTARQSESMCTFHPIVACLYTIREALMASYRTFQARAGRPPPATRVEDAPGLRLGVRCRWRTRREKAVIAPM